MNKKPATNQPTVEIVTRLTAKTMQSATVCSSALEVALTECCEKPLSQADGAVEISGRVFAWVQEVVRRSTLK